MPKQLFEDVFRKDAIHETLFVNTKAVLIYPTLKDKGLLPSSRSLSVG